MTQPLGEGNRKRTVMSTYEVLILLCHLLNESEPLRLWHSVELRCSLLLTAADRGSEWQQNRVRYSACYHWPKLQSSRSEAQEALTLDLAHGEGREHAEVHTAQHVPRGTRMPRLL